MNPVVIGLGILALSGTRRKKRRKMRVAGQNHGPRRVESNEVEDLQAPVSPLPDQPVRVAKTSTRAVELAKEAGGEGRQAPEMNKDITGVKKSNISFTVFPSSKGAIPIATPSNNESVSVYGDLEAISVPNGWWKKAEGIFHQVEGTVEERIAEIMLSEFGGYSEELREGDAYQQLERALMRRGARWVRAEKRKSSAEVEVTDE